jgi:hypothetical protein
MRAVGPLSIRVEIVMDSTAFRANAESEARLLLLIDAFTQAGHSVQGRVKLAKLDFLLRYPQFYRRALEAKGKKVTDAPEAEENDIETRMVRYRYGPWDPAYYSLLGSLFGRGLIETIPEGRYVGLRTTDLGAQLASEIGNAPAWAAIHERAGRLRTTFGTVTGTTMKKFIYEHFPEVSEAQWGEEL